MTEWQPIETALARARVLVFSTKYGVVIARRSGDVWSSDLGHAVDDEDGGFYLDSPLEAGLTHWMPLPAPPER